MNFRISLLLIATGAAMASSEATRSTLVAESSIPALFTVTKNANEKVDEGMRVLLQDAVLDSAAPEVSIPMQSGLDLIIIWGPGKTPGAVKQLRDRAAAQPAGSDDSNGERLVMSGTVKGYQQGETMVTFVVSASSYYCSASFPVAQENGDVKTRIVQVQSLPGEAYAGIETERFAPDMDRGDAIKINVPNSD